VCDTGVHVGSTLVIEISTERARARAISRLVSETRSTMMDRGPFNFLDESGLTNLGNSASIIRILRYRTCLTILSSFREEKLHVTEIIARLMRAERRRNFYRRGTFNDQPEKGFTFAIKRHRNGDNYRARALARSRTGSGEYYCERAAPTPSI